ncbi:polymer-forming cytoskeletal protein [Hyphomonas sp. WL0036]|uniref:bactofilin family protein n=1 Tax=Hyphomonas sediminis TaxID=2866160 RepID=UPI001C7E48FF|nr:polymer-forming cytoskeletal protein [Hyphomonas sediminis]MBY9065581.1 polymer-forming cytoskeletal protein [Hyphomonas sediminis]
MAATAPAPTRVAPPSGQLNVISAGCRVVGNLTFSGSLRLGGEVEGDVICDGLLTVDAGAQINGRVRAGEITVMGKIIGEIVAVRRIEVGRGAHVEGSVFSPSMLVEGNARVDGDLLIAPERSQAHIDRAKTLVLLKPAAPSPAETGTSQAG